MRLKALLLTMLVAGVAASLAVAAPADKGRPEDGAKATPTTKTQTSEHKDARPERRRPVTLLLSGRFVSASGDSFAMLVKHSNRFGKSLRGKQVTLLVDDKTKLRRHGQGEAELADLAEGDRLVVLARAARGEGANARLELTARLVHAKPAGPAAERKREADKPKPDKPKTDTSGERTKTGTVESSK